MALQKIDKIMQENGLKIPGAEANRIEVNFLDVTMNLVTESYKPFLKPRETIKYVHAIRRQSSRTSPWESQRVYLP